MSAPDTNIDAQSRRHRPSLMGMIVAGGFAALLLITFLIYVVDLGGTPQGAETQIDGRTGAVVAD